MVVVMDMGVGSFLDRLRPASHLETPRSTAPSPSQTYGDCQDFPAVSKGPIPLRTGVNAVSRQDHVIHITEHLYWLGPSHPLMQNS